MLRWPRLFSLGAEALVKRAYGPVFDGFDEGAVAHLFQRVKGQSFRDCVDVIASVPLKAQGLAQHSESRRLQQRHPLLGEVLPKRRDRWHIKHMADLAGPTRLHILQGLLQKMRPYREVVIALPGNRKEDNIKRRLSGWEGPVGNGSDDLVSFFEDKAPFHVRLAARQQTFQILLHVLRVLRLAGYRSEEHTS